MSTYKLSQSNGPSTRALSPPTVPAAIANGGLRWADLQDPESPVSVQVVLAPDTVFINDRIDLYWQEVAVATTTVKQEQLDVGVVTLPVLPRDILEHDDGPHILYYIATAAIGGGTSPSRDATVEVKRLIPGGYDSDAGTEYINENLAAPTGIPELIDDAMAEVGITVTVVAYQNMAAGDRLQLDWGGQRLLHDPLVDSQVGQPVTFLVTKDTLVAAPGPVVVRYEVRDKVNNWSKWSLSAQTDVEAGGDLLAAPRVVDAVGGIIDLAVLGEKDAHVQTPPYPDMESGDSVVLTWQGETAEGVAIPVIQSHDVLGDEVGWPLDFYIPNDKVRTIAQGQAVSTYKVTPVTGQPIPSRRTTTRVIGKVALFPPPTVQGAVGGVLDPADLPSTGAILTILASDLIKPGNFISLLWDGVTAGGTSLPYHDDFPVTGSMEGGPIDRPIPLVNITPLLNGTATASFILMKDGAQLPSDSQVVQIKSQDAYLPIPTIDFAEGDTLDPANVPVSGTRVRINYAPMQSNDRVDIHWDGLLDYTDFFPVPAGWGNKEVSFAISKNYVDLNKDQTVQVFYTVTRAGVLLPASIKQPLSIGSALELPGGSGGLPEVKWTEQIEMLEPYEGQYMLDKILSLDGQVVEIPFYENKKENDLITYEYVSCEGGFLGTGTPVEVAVTKVSDSYTVPLGEINSSSSITLPIEAFFYSIAVVPIHSLGIYGVGKITYSVTPEDSSTATPRPETIIYLDTRNPL